MAFAPNIPSMQPHIRAKGDHVLIAVFSITLGIKLATQQAH
ncbi:MAG: hypothetical protein ACRECW_17455 [Phyllobacterium sp.]